MFNLLSANFIRLKKDKIFYLILISVFLTAFILISISANGIVVSRNNGIERSLDDYFFVMAPYMGAIYAIFISLFLGTEHSDGTIRNKIIIGHTRTDIFLANYFCCLFSCLTIAVVWLLACTPGIFTIGMFKMSIGELLAYFFVIVGFTMVYCALFTGLNMINTNKAITIVLTLVIWVALIFFASGINDRLAEEPMLGGTAFIDGKFVTVAPTPNPLYLSGIVRMIFECILDALPSGQAILMNKAAISYPLRQILFSVLLTGVFISIGIAIFRKKDLK